MACGSGKLVDWASLSKIRGQLGEDFGRILNYFREDGARSLAQLEEAMGRRDAAGLVLPAHRLKAEALLFGAELLGLLAEKIEHRSRRCVEFHETPDELIGDVAQLRPLFTETLALFDREEAPSVSPRRRLAGFGRKRA